MLTVLVEATSPARFLEYVGISHRPIIMLHHIYSRCGHRPRTSLKLCLRLELT